MCVKHREAIAVVITVITEMSSTDLGDFSFLYTNMLKGVIRCMYIYFNLTLLNPIRSKYEGSVLLFGNVKVFPLLFVQSLLLA